VSPTTRRDTSDGDVDVAVVGAGPVGTVLAILLAQLGRRVALLERWPHPYPLPRAVHFDHEIGRILQACGLGGELASISEPADVYEWRNASGLPLLRFGRTGPGASGWPQSSMFNQPALEQLLADRAASLPDIAVRRGREVTALDADERGVVVRHRATPAGSPGEGAGDDEQVTRAAYVIGCDGANSTVRTLIGSPVHDLGFFYDWLIVDVVLHEERTYDPINVQICDPARPSTAVSGGPGRRRWEFMRLPGEPPEALDDEAAAWRLLEAWDVHPGNATLERHALYTFQARWAERWRAGRVLLGGDAAHQMPPFAGQGMCSGLRDAANLAWKLDLVLTGRVDDAVLDSYELERMPNVQAVIDFSMSLGKVICVPDPVEAAARDELMSAGVVDGEVSEVPDLPGITEGLVDGGSAEAGRLFPQGIVDDGRCPRLFDDVAGAGLRLVTRPGATRDVGAALLGWFGEVGGVVVEVGGALADVQGDYDAWFTAHGVTAALQRPDFHVFGTAATDADTPRLLAAFRAALPSPHP
jgi:2-polyprenyl-6-methoxyphenol hydroxylase-like FAD-dependent oxidoreductase